MRKTKGQKLEQKSKTVYKILLFITAALIIILVSGTILGINTNKTEKTEWPDFKDTVTKNLFDDLGRIRILTADKQAGAAVVSPVLEYNGDDKAFQEELIQKKEEIRTVVLNWFSTKSVYELYTMPDETIKKELLHSINELLDLSKVKNLYFKEFVILN